MAPLDQEQRAEVQEMIKQSHAVMEGELVGIRAAANKGHEDMRVTTEAEIEKQRAHNLEVETKYLELTKSIQAQLAALSTEMNQSRIDAENALRLELGKEFDNNKKSTAEVQGLVAELQVQKQNMVDGVDKQFMEFQEKSGEMKALIDQSGTILQET